MSSSCSYYQSWPIHRFEEIYRDIQKSENAPSLVDDVRNLVEWLKTQPHLAHIEIDQTYLITTLLLQKGLEKAKKHLEFHYTSRALHPELFTDWDPSTTLFQNIYNIAYYIPSKVLTSDGNKIALFGFGNSHNNSLPTVYDFFREFTMLATHTKRFAPSKASIIIFDGTRTTNHLMQLFLVATPKIFPLFLKINSTRVFKIYLLNPHPLSAKAISLIKMIPGLNKKVGDRIEIWNRNVNELVSVLPAECLPSDYGGSCPSIDELKDEYYQCIVQQRDWFMNECQKKARLDVRPKIVDDEEDLFGFGVDGTFRTISVD